MFSTRVLQAIWYALLVNSVCAVRVDDAEASVGSDSEGSVDWSSLVKPAPFQGGVCNSCYVWAAIGSLEARMSIATGKPLVELSTQQALDCARAEHMKPKLGMK